MDHVVPCGLRAADPTDGMEAKTAGSRSSIVSADGDAVMVGVVTATQADVAASDGVNHAVDMAMMPQT